MLNAFKCKAEPLIGIDISSSFIKAIELSYADNQYVVETYGVTPLPPDSVVEKNIKAMDKVVIGVQTLMHGMAATRRFAAVAVAGSGVLNRVIQVSAALQDREIEEQIIADLDHYVSYPLEEIYYDFSVLGPSLKDPGQKEVLLAAARVEAVDTRLTVLASAGIKATIVDIETLVMERSFKWIMKHIYLKEAGTIGLIDMGTASMTLYVFENLRMMYVREQSLGGKPLTEELFTQQVDRALQLFFASVIECEIACILLAGDAATFPGIDRAIAESVGIKTFVANPFLEMACSGQIDKKQLVAAGPSLMLAFGLALRTFNHE